MIWIYKLEFHHQWQLSTIFILDHNSEEVEEVSQTPDPNPGNLPVEKDFGTPAHRPPNAAEKARAKRKRDRIAQEMWNSYQAILAERGENFVLE